MTVARSLAGRRASVWTPRVRLDLGRAGEGNAALSLSLSLSLSLFLLAGLAAAVASYAVGLGAAVRDGGRRDGR